MNINAYSPLSASLIAVKTASALITVHLPDSDRSFCRHPTSLLVLECQLLEQECKRLAYISIK